MVSVSECLMVGGYQIRLQQHGMNERSAISRCALAPPSPPPPPRPQPYVLTACTMLDAAFDGSKDWLKPQYVYSGCGPCEPSEL